MLRKAPPRPMTTLWQVAVAAFVVALVTNLILIQLTGSGIGVLGVVLVTAGCTTVAYFRGRRA